MKYFSSRLLVGIFALLSIVIFFNRGQDRHNQFVDDRCGYYLYLPATFIYHDLQHLSFFDSVNGRYGNSMGMQYSLYPVNGNRLDKYTMGVALFEAPFFFAANAGCNVARQYPADGFSLPYQLALLASNLFWVCAGLLVLATLLGRYYSKGVVLATLTCVWLGTNLYCFTAFDIGMSHPISFFLFSVLLLLSDSWYSTAGNKTVQCVLIALCLGLITLVRPVNILVGIIPLLWNGLRLPLHPGRKVTSLLVAGCVFLLVLMPQLLYWHYITGSYVCYSYGDEGFNFAAPHIADGLFGFRKGWFVYTPMAAVAIAGLFSFRKSRPHVLLPVAVFLGVMIYVVFSWREWWYGGSFGCRPMVEVLAVLALPLAALINSVFTRRSRVVRFFLSCILCLVISLNVFQTYQYSMGLIHWDRMTGTYYRKVFGRVEFDRRANEQYLLKK